MQRKLLKDFPELHDQIYEKSELVQILKFASKSHKKIMWVCEQGSDHIWSATIANRVSTFIKKGLVDSLGLTIGCPYCQKRLPCSNYNLEFYMEENHPEIWTTFDRNSNRIDPSKVLPFVDEKYVWICQSCKKNTFIARPKDVFRSEEEKRQKHCKECLGLRGKVYQKTMVTKYGSLLDKMPSIIDEWDYELNELGPEHYSSNSHQRVWFKCEFGHPSYKAIIYNKFNKQTKCPKCTVHASEVEIRLYTELEAKFECVEWQFRDFGKELDIFVKDLNLGIEVDGFPWHEEKLNKDIEKTEFFASKGVRILRVRDINLTATLPDSIRIEFLNFTFSKFKSVCDFLYASTGAEAFILGEDGGFSKDLEFRKIYSELPKPPFEKSLAYKFPNVAAEFDLEKNYPFTPEMFAAHSQKKVFWLCEKGHSFETRIGHRTRGLSEFSKRSGKSVGKATNCSICAGRYATSQNNVTVTHPFITEYWDFERNAKQPNDFKKSSLEEVYFKCKLGHSFTKSIKNFLKSKYLNCPGCLELGNEKTLK